MEPPLISAMTHVQFNSTQSIINTGLILYSSSQSVHTCCNVKNIIRKVKADITILVRDDLYLVNK